MISESSKEKFLWDILFNGMVDSMSQVHISTWADEKQLETRCFTFSIDSKIRSFVLLRKCEFDPFSYHSSPYIIYFIYTYPQYRNKKYASKLLRFIKNNFQTTAFCSNVYSENLFKSVGFKLQKNDDMPIPTYRYP